MLLATSSTPLYRQIYNLCISIIVATHRTQKRLVSLTQFIPFCVTLQGINILKTTTASAIVKAKMLCWERDGNSHIFCPSTTKTNFTLPRCVFAAVWLVVESSVIQPKQTTIFKKPKYTCAKKCDATVLFNRAFRAKIIISI